MQFMCGIISKSIYQRGVCMFEDRNETQLAQDSIFELDYDEYLPGIEIIENFDEILLFKNAVLKRAAALSFSGSTDSELVSFLVSLCKDSRAIISRQTLTNWITSGTPNGSSQSRENVYKLCFALKFNEKSTEEFFLKAYLEKPFNFKSISECVYYYCLKNGLAFSEACRIIDEINNTPVSQADFAEEDTITMGNTIRKITNEKKLKEYISENKELFGEHSKTALKELNHLIESCMTIANEENKNYGNGKEIKSIDALLSIIYGYSARETVSDKSGKRKKLFATSISKSRFPKYIKSNFPQRQQLENILKGKGTFDSIRKALVILEFYNFYGDALIKHKSSPDLFDEFTDELNLLLEECSYIQMYWRNPLDWMIGYCAYADNPLDEFRGLIEEFYLSEAE